MSATNQRRLPSIIVVGPGRTGTTWLHRVLEGHVDLPYGIKETLFFSHFYDKGIDWYERNFRYATGARPIVEICPPYFFKLESIARIKTHIPDCKIVATMRDPVDRVYSKYKLVRYKGAARRGTFEQTLAAWPSIADGARYAFHLSAWFQAFGRENVLVTLYDELRATPQQYLNRVTDFMGVEPIALADRSGIGNDVNTLARAPKNPKLARRANQLRVWLKGHQAYGVVKLLARAGVWEFCRGRGELFPPLTPEQDATLRARYLPEVEALEELLMIDLSAWKKPRTPRTVESSPSSPRLQRLANG